MIECFLQLYYYQLSPSLDGLKSEIIIFLEMDRNLCPVFFDHCIQSLSEAQGLELDSSHYMAHPHHFLRANHILHALWNLPLDKSNDFLVGWNIAVTKS